MSVATKDMEQAPVNELEKFEGYQDVSTNWIQYLATWKEASLQAKSEDLKDLHIDTLRTALRNKGLDFVSTAKNGPNAGKWCLYSEKTISGRKMKAKTALKVAWNDEGNDNSQFDATWKTWTKDLLPIRHKDESIGTLNGETISLVDFFKL